MAFVPKNYKTDGGDKTVIGGTLEFVGGGRTVGLIYDGMDSTDINKALSANMGSVISAALTSKISKNSVENQADSTASTIAALVVDFNALLAKLKAAGLMVADA